MGTKNALTEKVYSGKDIMRIAYPILISLLMEQMIGMTDTAFLGQANIIIDREINIPIDHCALIKIKFHIGFDLFRLVFS